MKKTLFLVLILVLTVSVWGCGGSNKPPQKGSGYTYKWSPGVSSASVEALNFGTMSEGEEGEDPPPPVYSGSVVPPFACVRYGTNETVMGVVLSTYYDGTPVESDYACDPANGSMGKTGTGEEYFKPAKTGILPITATYNGEVLTIPVHAYPAYTCGLVYFDFDTMTVHPDGSDPGVDVLFNNANFKSRYGYQALPYATVISEVTSVPGGEYKILGFDQDYWAAYFDNVDRSIIKTSENKYVKLCFLSTGPLGATFCFLISDNAGVFEY